MIGTVTELRTPPFVSPDRGENTAKTKHWTAAIGESASSLAGLRDLNYPPCESVLGPWFCEGDLGFIYGPRGLGKTWLALHLGVQIAEGGKVANWQAPKRRRVLYIMGRCL